MAILGRIGTILAQSASRGLDRFTYSVRLVNPSYTGPCLRVKHSATGTETDIGFSAGLIDETALDNAESEAGGFLYVVIWYSQYDAYHAYQANTALCYTIGTAFAEKVNAIPALIAQDEDSYMATEAFEQPLDVSAATVVSVYKTVINISDQIILGTTTSPSDQYIGFTAIGRRLEISGTGTYTTGYIQTNAQELMWLVWGGVNDELYMNKISETVNVGSPGVLNDLIIGNGKSTLNDSIEFIQELDFHASDQSANRVALSDAAWNDFGM